MYYYAPLLWAQTRKLGAIEVFDSIPGFVFFVDVSCDMVLDLVEELFFVWWNEGVVGLCFGFAIGIYFAVERGGYLFERI